MSTLDELNAELREAQRRYQDATEAAKVASEAANAAMVEIHNLTGRIRAVQADEATKTAAAEKGVWSSNGYLLKWETLKGPDYHQHFLRWWNGVEGWRASPVPPSQAPPIWMVPLGCRTLHLWRGGMTFACGRGFFYRRDGRAEENPKTKRCPKCAAKEVP